MKIGLLNGGGDCPGLNAVTRGVVRDALLQGSEIIGFLEGWRGVVEGNTRPVGRSAVTGILRQGGTILRTSRTNPFRDRDVLEKMLATWKGLQLDALIAVGGEDTLGVAARLYAEYDWPVVGVPKTIDNDLSGTDYTFGFDTAVSIATEAIDRLHTTAESHNRVMVVEVMGRHAGWIALHSGVAGGADFIAIPERTSTVVEICEVIQARAAQGRSFSIIVVAEGANLDGIPIGDGAKTDEFGHELLGGIGHRLAAQIEAKTGFDTRVTVLGHVQRGGTPTAYDRFLATRYGVAASRLVHAGDFGKMPALRGAEIVSIPIAEAVATPKVVPEDLWKMSEVFYR